MEFLLNHLLERSARRLPQKQAVLCNDSSLSYLELDRLSTLLAHVLIDNGLRRGERVGIWMAKSAASIVSIHGILKAGGVYVPLDPYAPAARVGYVMNNCGVTVLISAPQHLARLRAVVDAECPLATLVLMEHGSPPPPDFPVHTVSYGEVLAHGAAEPPRIESIGTDLAYILYTSGSTGTPKGVMISHQNALNFVNWACDEFRVHDGDVLSNHAPYHFDLSIFDVFAAMKTGATLAIVSEEDAHFPYRLVDWIHENGISVWYSVPSILSMMVRRGDLERFQFDRLRLVLFAGEVFPVKYLRELMQRLPGPEYCNLYGPTETNVITYHYLREPPDERAKSFPIGLPCSNMEVFALDEAGEVIRQPGIEGELYARGPNVAQGYWGDREKTAGVFIDNPLHSPFRETVYRTGDIVTLDEDGSYVFRGRRDQMIKSRGYRIELGEIESVLYNHPEVLEAAVLPIPDEEIGNRIKAFVRIGDADAVDAAEIRSHCAQFLPSYMVPESVEFLETFPKTSTGKVDKPALSTRT